MPLKENRKYTAEEYLALTPETNEKSELIYGEIVAQAAPSIQHQRISREVSFQLVSYVKSKGGKCEVFSAPTDVKLDEYTVVQPDIFIGCDPERFDKQKFNGAPDLVIEIVSSNLTDDYSTKLELYKNSGVREYWIIDPKVEKTVVYLFGDRVEVNIYTFDKPIPVSLYNGEISITVKDML
ncbi:Uma2 family endonuclease [Ruminococcus sp. NK3A76]|uniref:Uma2 family endonuclease n=1 Tax=Ruminococcus sp. NK3A76 TaxID=877411 RepID=UPI00048D15D3|nr:Uma2 family endonuclease [Ruminococcus sp. NK3A76]